MRSLSPQNTNLKYLLFCLPHAKWDFTQFVIKTAVLFLGKRVYLHKLLFSNSVFSTGIGAGIISQSHQALSTKICADEPMGLKADARERSTDLFIAGCRKDDGIKFPVLCHCCSCNVGHSRLEVTHPKSFHFAKLCSIFDVLAEHCLEMNGC